MRWVGESERRRGLPHLPSSHPAPSTSMYSPRGIGGAPLVLRASSSRRWSIRASWHSACLRVATALSSRTRRCSTASSSRDEERHGSQTHAFPTCLTPMLSPHVTLPCFPHMSHSHFPLYVAGFFWFGRPEHYRASNWDGHSTDRPLVVQFCGDDPQTVLAAAR